MNTGSVRTPRARFAGRTTRSASRYTSAFTAVVQAGLACRTPQDALNGLWLRMPQITVESVAQFQIGEQRFQLKVK